MNNKGNITVFLCLILSVMLLLGLTVINVVKNYSYKEQAVMSARIALRNVRAEYNSYIFENYHILLFDMEYGGKREGAIEEKIKRDIESNLGEDFTVEEVALTSYTGVMDNDCYALKEQVSDYIAYALAEDVGEKILESTGGTDGTLPDEVADAMESGEFDVAGNVDENEESEDEKDVDDPRDVASKLGNLGILSFVMPKDLKLSDTVLDIFSLPSYGCSGLLSEFQEINYDFDDYDRLKSDLNSSGEWADDIKNCGVGVIYADEVFNCATNNQVNQSSVLVCEREYLICGKSTDYQNLKGVVEKIIAIRFPVNFTYLVTDASKRAEIKKVTGIIGTILPVAEPIFRYLISGAWAYIESVAEVRALLEGKTITFNKNSGNWITDIYNLEESIYGEIKEDESGLDYEDYLAILLAMKSDEIYPRMLDIIQINTIENSGDIKLNKCAVELSVDIQISYPEGESSFNISGGY